VLEALRQVNPEALLLYTSTNKVYGRMEEVAVVDTGSCYAFSDVPKGIPETYPLDFHSPYGCSKGGADAYVRDYARIYDLSTVVFRMSCIYGTRQFGNVKIKAGSPTSSSQRSWVVPSPYTVTGNRCGISCMWMI